MLAEFIVSVEVDVLPSDRRNLPEQGCCFIVTRGLRVLQQMREQRCVVEDDAVRNQTAAFFPYLLLVLRLEAKLAEVGVSNGSA